MDILILVAVACLGIGFERGAKWERGRVLRRRRTDAAAFDAAQRRHLSSGGHAADGSDELPADGDSAATAARVHETRRAGA